MSTICSECGNLESLPFKCNDCNKYFCRKHYSYDKHKCLDRKLNNYRYVPESNIRTKCHFIDCQNEISTSAFCNKCSNNFCENHKYPWHSCSIKKSKKSFIQRLKSCFCLD